MQSIYFKIFLFIIIVTLLVIEFTTIFNSVNNNPDHNLNPLPVISSCPLTTTSTPAYKNYRVEYSFLLECQNKYSSWTNWSPIPSGHNYSQEAPASLHTLRITRAVLFYFPIERVNEFGYEFKWVYRSWVNMLEYEPPNWRTNKITD